MSRIGVQHESTSVLRKVRRGQAGRGTVRLGEARRGADCNAVGWAFARVRFRVRRGPAWQGQAWQGVAWYGEGSMTNSHLNGGMIFENL